MEMKPRRDRWPVEKSKDVQKDVGRNRCQPMSSWVILFIVSATL